VAWDDVLVLVFVPPLHVVLLDHEIAEEVKVVVLFSC